MLQNDILREHRIKTTCVVLFRFVHDFFIVYIDFCGTYDADDNDACYNNANDYQNSVRAGIG